MENESIPLRSILRAARVAFGNASCSSSSRTTITAHHHHHHRRNTTTTTPDDKRQSNASQEWRYFSSPGKISPPWKEWASLCIMFVYLYWCVCCLLLLLLLLLLLPAELYIDSRGVVFFRWTADRLFKTDTMATGETFSLHNSITRSHISEEKKSTPAREASVRKLSLTVWFVFVVVPRKQRFNNTKARWKKKRERERKRVSCCSRKLERRERRKREQKNNTFIERKKREIKDDKRELSSHLELSTASHSLPPLLLRASSSLQK